MLDAKLKRAHANWNRRSELELQKHS